MSEDDLRECTDPPTPSVNRHLRRFDYEAAKYRREWAFYNGFQKYWILVGTFFQVFLVVPLFSLTLCFVVEGLSREYIENHEIDSGKLMVLFIIAMTLLGLIFTVYKMMREISESNGRTSDFWYLKNCVNHGIISQSKADSILRNCDEREEDDE